MQPICIIKQTQIIVLQGNIPSQLTLIPLKTKWTPNEKPLLEKTSEYAPLQRIRQSEPVIGVYQSHPLKINPKEKTTFEYSFYLRAKSPDTTFSATVALRDKNGSYIDRLTEKGWFHWAYPILFKKPSAIWPETPEKIVYQIVPGSIPIEANFIEFGLNLNHKGEKVVYQICGVSLKKVQ